MRPLPRGAGRAFMASDLSVVALGKELSLVSPFMQAMRGVGALPVIWVSRPIGRGEAMSDDVDEVFVERMRVSSLGITRPSMWPGAHKRHVG